MDVKIVLVVLPLVALLAVFIGYMGHKLTIARTLGDADMLKHVTEMTEAVRRVARGQ